MSKTRMDGSHVLLSVVVVVVSGPSHLRRCLNALLQQVDPPEMEILVPHAAYDAEVAALQPEFPAVRFCAHSRLDTIPEGGPYRPHAYLDLLRGEGIRASRGEIVALTEDHARVNERWAHSMIAAHASGSVAAVGGPIDNEVDAPLNWAVYFSDFGRYQAPVSTGPAQFLSDVNISYKRAALDQVQSAWQEDYHEPRVNEALRNQNAELQMTGDAILFQHRENLRLSGALHERFLWGRYYAANRVRKFSLPRRAAHILLSPVLPLLLVFRMIREVFSRGRNVAAFLRAFPLFVLLTSAWSLGELFGYVTGSADSSRESRRLAFNFTFLSAGEAFSKVLSFLAFTLLARVLAPSGFGALEFTIAVMVFFQLFVDFGTSSYGARGIARKPEDAGILIGNIATLRTLLAVAGYGLIAAFAFVAVHDPETRRLILLYGLTLFAVPGLLQWVFQGYDRMKPVAVASVLRQSVFAVLVLLLVRSRNQLRLVPWMEIAAVVCVVISNLFVLKRQLPALRVRWSLGGASRTMRESLPIGLSELTWASTWYFPTILLGLMIGGNAVGWFGAAQRPVMTLHTFVWLYFYNMLPSLSRAVDQPREVLRSLLGASLQLTAWPAVFVAVAGTLFAEPALVLVFGEGYRQSTLTFQILIWVLSVALLSGHYRYVLIAFNHQRYEFLSSLYTAILSIGLCALLIPRYGSEGAAAALLFSGIVNWWLAFRFVQQKVDSLPMAGFLVRPIAAGALVYGACFLLMRWNLWLAAIASIVLFGALFLVLQPHRKGAVA